jgi:hypothetical protein
MSFSEIFVISFIVLALVLGKSIWNFWKNRNSN